MIEIDLKEYEGIKKRREEKARSVKRMLHVKRLDYWQRLEYNNYVLKGLKSYPHKANKMRVMGFSDIEIVKIIGVGL